MTQPYVQREALRDPADGRSILTEILQLNYAWDDTGADLVLNIPATASEPILLFDVGHVVTTLFTGGTPSIDVGDGTDVDAFVDTTAITEGTAGNIAWGRDAAGSEAKAKGQYLTSNLAITVTLSASLSAGAGTVLAYIARLA